MWSWSWLISWCPEKPSHIMMSTCSWEVDSKKTSISDLLTKYLKPLVGVELAYFKQSLNVTLRNHSGYLVHILLPHLDWTFKVGMDFLFPVLTSAFPFSLAQLCRLVIAFLQFLVSRWTNERSQVRWTKVLNWIECAWDLLRWWGWWPSFPPHSPQHSPSPWSAQFSEQEGIRQIKFDKFTSTRIPSANGLNRNFAHRLKNYLYLMLRT